MALDDEQAALGVEIHDDRMHDVRRGGEQLDHQTRVADLGGFVLRRAGLAGGERGRKKEAK